MPVIVDKRRALAGPTAGKSSHPQKVILPRSAETPSLNIALLNNMPDPALEDTDLQFADLLRSAAGDIPVRLKLYYLPGIARGNRVQERLKSSYFSIDNLWNNRFDGVIITGAEPRQPDLREETHWSALADVFDWAQEHTTSAILSCLAAHASVLHSDGIHRTPLPNKRFGVFSERQVCDHTLLDGVENRMRFPHSRWNEVQEGALAAAGYTVLTKSDEAGVNLFVKKKKKSLFVYFQGHPEYGVRTLLKEYRRDIGRFLKHERETYPSMPREYFDTASTEMLIEFQENALINPHKGLMAKFPEDAVAGSLKNSWSSPAVSIYRNWLHDMASKRPDLSVFSHAACSVRR